MPSPEFQTLLTALLLAGGVGVFLRIVGNEKNRREKWLQLRLEEKIKEIEMAQKKATEEDQEATLVEEV